MRAPLGCKGLPYRNRSAPAGPRACMHALSVGRLQRHCSPGSGGYVPAAGRLNKRTTRDTQNWLAAAAKHLISSTHRHARNSCAAATRHQVPPSTSTGWRASLNGQLLKLAYIGCTVACYFACVVNFASGGFNSVSFTFFSPLACPDQRNDKMLP